MADIQARGSLRVAVDQNTDVFGFRNLSTGELQGVDIDIAHEVARAIFGDPNKIDFTFVTLDQRFQKLDSKEVDIVAARMAITCKRLEKVSFSTVYYEARQQVLVRQDSTVNNLGDLGDKRVCAAAKSTSIERIAMEPSRPIPVSASTATDCLILLHQGQIDAISTNDTILMGLRAQDPTLKIVGPYVGEDPYGLGMPKGADDFVRFVNGVLEQMRTNGRLAEIYQTWITPQYRRFEQPERVPPEPHYQD